MNKEAMAEQAIKSRREVVGLSTPRRERRHAQLFAAEVSL
jgi:hypothetical protein